MKFFKIFKKRKIDLAHDDTVLFYHEDDYCQIELSPKENLFAFQKESEEINDLTEKNFDGQGYTNIYVRGDNKISLSERKINPIDLEMIISEIGLMKASQVTTGYGQTYRENQSDTVGFGKGYSAIYFDFKDNTVTNIWMTGHFSMEKEKLIQCLLNLGQKWDLILMDWNQTLAIDLADPNEIREYLTK